MQTVNDRWYILFQRCSAAMAFVVVAAFGASMAMPSFHDKALEWGITYVTLVLALAQIVYALGFYRNQVRRLGIRNATLAAALLQTLTLVNLIQGSGKLTSFYLILWGLTVYASGMFGTYATVGYFFISIIYYVSVLTDSVTRKAALQPLAGAAFIGGTLVIAIISHLVWRRQYVKTEKQKLAALSGIVANKDQQAEILVESIADAIVIINTEGKISLLNTAGATMFGWPTDEAIGIDVQLVMKVRKENGQEMSPGENPFAKVLVNKEKLQETMQLVSRDGKEYIVSVTISPVIVPDKKEMAGVVAVIRDISADKAEENRRADFVSTASHEMRTPVAAIEGYLQLALNDKVSQIDIKARSFLEKALDSTHHLGKLFQDLLTSAKAEDGRLVSHPVVTEMGQYLDELSDSLRFAAQKKGLLMEYIVGASAQEHSSVGGGKVVKPLYYVFVDPDRLREVITNLFDNAVKYTDSGKISIALTGNNDVVQLYIKDTGPGIAPEDINHLFQKFYRVDNTNTRTIGGTGLGLFICRKIVELYHGRVWVESTLGQGSTFYINLPRLTSQKAAELQAKEAQSTGT